MDFTDTSCVVKNAFSKCRLARINVGRNTNVSQICNAILLSIKIITAYTVMILCLYLWAMQLMVSLSLPESIGEIAIIPNVLFYYYKQLISRSALTSRANGVIKEKNFHYIYDHTAMGLKEPPWC